MLLFSSTVFLPASGSGAVTISFGPEVGAFAVLEALGETFEVALCFGESFLWLRNAALLLNCLLH